jgi:quinol monooxygenase YgiN
MAESKVVVESKEATRMHHVEVRAGLKVREDKLERCKQQAAEMMRQTKEKDTGTLAYD